MTVTVTVPTRWLTVVFADADMPMGALPLVLTAGFTVIHPSAVVASHSAFDVTVMFAGFDASAFIVASVAETDNTVSPGFCVTVSV